VLASVASVLVVNTSTDKATATGWLRIRVDFPLGKGSFKRHRGPSPKKSPARQIAQHAAAFLLIPSTNHVRSLIGEYESARTRRHRVVGAAPRRVKTAASQRLQI